MIDRRQDNLRAARGIILACAVSFPLWLAVAAAIGFARSLP